MTKLIYDQTDGEKAQPMSIAKTNEDYNKKQPLPNDPDLGEHTPLIEIPNISDKTFDVSRDNSIYPHSLFMPHHNMSDPESYIPDHMNNTLYDGNALPEGVLPANSNHFVSRIGNSNSINEFSTD